MRKFTVISQWLKAQKLILEEQCQIYFWLGVSDDIKDKVETHLLAGNITKDISKPFSIREICKIVERLLHCYQFDARITSSKHYVEDSSSESSADSDSDSDSSSDSDSEPSESEESDYISKHHRKSKIKDKKPSKQWKSKENVVKSLPTTKSKDSKEDKKKSTKKAEPDMDSLINDMSHLKLSNPAYGQSLLQGIPN